MSAQLSSDLESNEAERVFTHIQIFHSVKLFVVSLYVALLCGWHGIHVGKPRGEKMAKKELGIFDLVRQRKELRKEEDAAKKRAKALAEKRRRFEKKHGF